jgi:DNA-binding NarL/FixJ family response regulator
MRTVRILIADDHAIVRRGLRTLIEAQEGWVACAEASNGREAVEKTEELKPDIAILDIGMPELNGLDAARKILKSSPQTEVLILTMHHSEEVAAEVLKAGPRGYVLKSDADHNLVAAIGALLQHKPYLSPDVTEMVLSDYVSGHGTASSEPRTRITSREREIIQLLAEGKSNKEVASALEISTRTVETHRAHVMHKLGLASFGDLVRFAIRNNLVQP